MIGDSVRQSQALARRRLQACAVLLVLSACWASSAHAEELEIVCAVAAEPQQPERVFVIDTDRKTALEMSGRGITTGTLEAGPSEFVLTLTSSAAVASVIRIDRASGAAKLDATEGTCTIKPAAKFRPTLRRG